MLLGVVKICKNCGPLTSDKVRKKSGRKALICRVCEKKSMRKTNKKRQPMSKEKYLLRKLPIEERNRPIIKCGRCKELKTEDQFNKYMLSMRWPMCRVCRRKCTKDNYDKNYEKYKNSYNKKYEPIATNKRYLKCYGITLDQYNQLLLEQNYCCAICKKHQDSFLNKNGKLIRLHVDHNHITGSIRGLLCFKCNAAIGLFDENVNVFNETIAYIDKYNK